VFVDTPSIDWNLLANQVLSFLNAENVPLQQTIFFLTHWSIAELRHIEDQFEDSHIVASDSWLHLTKTVGNYKFKVLDSFSIFTRSLDDVGKWIGVPKVTLEGVGTQPEKYWKEHMEELHKRHPVLFEQYALRDVEVLMKAFHQWRAFYLEKWGIDILHRFSLADLAAHIFETRYLNQPLAPTSIELKRYADKQRDGYRPRITKVEHYAGSRDFREFAMRCSWGPLNLAAIHGLYPKPVQVRDMKQFYPTVTLLSPIPVATTKWKYMSALDELPEVLSHEGFIRVRFRFPDECRCPTLPVYDLRSRSTKAYYPLRGESRCTIAEVRYAVSKGCVIDGAEAWYFVPREAETGASHPLKRFMRDLIQLKESYAENSLGYIIAKLMMNSVIGKFIQRVDEEDFESLYRLYRRLGSEQYKRLRYRRKVLGQLEKVVGRLFFPEGWGLILGYARLMMHQVCERTGAVLAITDSAFIPAGVDVEKAVPDILAKVRSVGSELELKTTAPKLWVHRTRTYALLNEQNQIVTAKQGGVPADNFEGIVATNLKAGSPVILDAEKKSLVKPKAMLQTGRRLGSQYIRKTRINWGFDFKRELNKPDVNPWIDYSETRPWNTVEDAIAAEEYDRAKMKRVPSKGSTSLTDVFKEVAPSNRGRPSRVLSFDRYIIHHWLEWGLSPSQIVTMYRGYYARSTIYRGCKALGGERS